MTNTTDQGYAWRVGDVFTNGTNRWAVDSIHGEKAVLRSCFSSWATTIPLTFSEWREGGRWRLEAVQAEDIRRRVYCHGCGDTIAADAATWHDGEPYCDVCEASPAEEDAVCDICGDPIEDGQDAASVGVYCSNASGDMAVCRSCAEAL